MKSESENLNQYESSVESQTIKMFNFIYRDKATGEIPMPLAIQLIRHYREKEKHENEEKPRDRRKGQSKCVWFSIAELDEIHKRVHETANGDGIRIYFGKYPDKDEFTNVSTYRQKNQDHAKKRTVVIVTTKEKDDHSEDDITEKDLITAFADGVDLEKLAAYNHGELCPKNCKGITKVP